MNSWKLPFTLNKGDEGDNNLLRYLKKYSNFSYLSSESIDIIERLQLQNNNNLRTQQKELLQLWPQVLTDALQNLKKHDTREYDTGNPKMDTFFDVGSLGIEELKSVLTGFFEFEGMMYGASPDRYRDHIAHSFRVWIIGQIIVRNCFKSKLFLIDGSSLYIKKKEWECMWAIVALCHDIGYPLSVIEKINRRARTTLGKQGLVPQGDLSFTFSQQILLFHDTIIKLMASKPVRVVTGQRGKYLTHLQNKYYLKFLKSFDSLDHGIISSLLISRSLVYFLESDLTFDSLKMLNKEDARQFIIRREILRAIASHTCQDIYHLYFNTLSFLLYIVDEIQCWGRPTLEELQHGPTDIRGGEATVKKFTNNQVDVSIKTDDEKWDEEQIKSIKFQVGKLRRMLRLAVDTPKLKESYLRFEVQNKGGQFCKLELNDGGINLSLSKG